MKKPVCKLVGTDGNAFSIIGKVSRTLKGAGQNEQAEQFMAKVKECANYDALLCLAMDFVDVR